MRRLAILAGLGLAVTTLAAAVAATAAPCDWAVSKVVVPDGYNRDFTDVKGTDTHGIYAGTSLRARTNTFDLIVSTGGQQRVVHELRHLQWMNMADENS